MAAPRVFVSHSHQDDKFTTRLVADLQRAGADVWYDVTGMRGGDFLSQINSALAGRDWFVLVLSPSSLDSYYVDMEVGAALVRVREGHMRGVIPIVAEKCDVSAKKPLWATLHRFDATTGYHHALVGLVSLLGLTLPKIPHSRPIEPAKPTEPARPTEQQTPRVASTPVAPRQDTPSAPPMAYSPVHMSPRTRPDFPPSTQIEHPSGRVPSATISRTEVQPGVFSLARLRTFLAELTDQWQKRSNRQSQNSRHLTKATEAVAGKYLLLAASATVAVSLVGGTSLYTPVSNCATSSAGDVSCNYSVAWLAAPGVGFLLFGFVLYLPVLALCSITALRRRQFGWLVTVIVVPILGMLLYPIFGISHEPESVTKLSDVISVLQMPWKGRSNVVASGIACLTLTGLFLTFIGSGIGIVSEQCSHTSSGLSCTSTSIAYAIGVILLVIGFICVLIAWVWGIVTAAATQSVVWTVVSVLVPVGGSLVYAVLAAGIAEPVKSLEPATTLMFSNPEAKGRND